MQQDEEESANEEEVESEVPEILSEVESDGYDNNNTQHYSPKPENPDNMETLEVEESAIESQWRLGFQSGEKEDKGEETSEGKKKEEDQDKQKAKEEEVKETPGQVTELDSSDDDAQKKAAFADTRGPLVPGEKYASKETEEAAGRIKKSVSRTTNEDIIAAQRKMRQAEKGMEVEEGQEGEDEDKMMREAEEESDEKKKRGSKKGKGKGKGKKKTKVEKDQAQGKARKQEEIEDQEEEEKAETKKQRKKDKGSEEQPKSEAEVDREEDKEPRKDDRDEKRGRKRSRANTGKASSSKAKKPRGDKEEEKEDEKEEASGKSKAKSAKQSPLKVAASAARRVVEQRRATAEQSVKRRIDFDQFADGKPKTPPKKRRTSRNEDTEKKNIDPYIKHIELGGVVKPSWIGSCETNTHSPFGFSSALSLSKSKEMAIDEIIMLEKSDPMFIIPMDLRKSLDAVENDKLPLKYEPQGFDVLWMFDIRSIDVRY